METFTVGFTEASFDKSPFARLVSDALGTRHHQEILDLNSADALIPDVLSRLDEPLSDASIIPTFLLSRFTRRHVTVALSGDGGDELFAGYDPFVALAPALFYNRFVPDGLHRTARRLVDLLPPSGRNMAIDFKLRRSLAGLSYKQSIWNPVWMGPVEPDAMADLFHAPLAADELYSEAITLWNRDASLDIVDRTLEFFTNFYLQDDILVKVDRAAMMSSLESRAVFLDNDLVAFCQRLPQLLEISPRHAKISLEKGSRRSAAAKDIATAKERVRNSPSEMAAHNSCTPPLSPITGVKINRAASIGGNIGPDVMITVFFFGAGSVYRAPWTRAGFEGVVKWRSGFTPSRPRQRNRIGGSPKDVACSPVSSVGSQFPSTARFSILEPAPVQIFGCSRIWVSVKSPVST